MQSEVQELADVNDGKRTDTRSRVIVFFQVLGRAVVWAFIVAAMVGSLAAAIWTIVPTEMLAWGASTPNLIGYVSHCSFAPISTAVLSAVSLIGMLMRWRIKRGREIAKGVFFGTTGGLLLGLLGGIDIVMFIGMGAGVGVGVLLGILIGLFRRSV